MIVLWDLCLESREYWDGITPMSRSRVSRISLLIPYLCAPIGWLSRYTLASGSIIAGSSWFLPRKVRQWETAWAHVIDHMVYILVKATYNNNNELSLIQEVSHMSERT